MQSCMNGVVIDGVHKDLALVSSQTKYVIQVNTPFDATYPVITPLQIAGVIKDFDVRKPTPWSIRIHVSSRQYL